MCESFKSFKNILAPVIKGEKNKDFDEKDMLFSVAFDTLDNWNECSYYSHV